MAVVELGNLWPGEGGVYIWATRTMGETWGFIGGYLSWIPVILNAKNEKIDVYNLTDHNLANAANYAELKQKLLDAAK